MPSHFTIRMPDIVFRFFRLVLGVMALGAVALLSAVTTMRFAIHGAEVAVPNLAGLSMAEAAQKTRAEGLNLNVENRFYSAETSSGRVLSQSPAPGVVVRREWHVRVTESLGPQKIAIPNVVGQRAREAAIFVRRTGLELGSQAYLPMAGAEPGLVIAQSPPPNAFGVDRPRVSLLLSQPDPPQQAAYVMPNLVGQTSASATAAINTAGLKLAPLQESTTPIPPVAETGTMAPMTATVAPGTVTAQWPLAGHRVSAGDVVRLTVGQ